MLRALTALDDGGASVCGGQDAVEALRQQGLVRLLLDALLALGPIADRRADRRPQQPPQAGPGAAHSARLKQPPYHGYRTDIIAGCQIFANNQKNSTVHRAAVLRLHRALMQCWQMRCMAGQPCRRRSRVLGARSCCLHSARCPVWPSILPSALSCSMQILSFLLQQCTAWANSRGLMIIHRPGG